MLRPEQARVVEFAIRAGLATNCAIAPASRFARKNYFYPDLCKGYQISMYEAPLCTGGHLDLLVDGGSRRIGLTRIHMEEDTGKNIHDGETSLVDFNRSGVPLLEIVSEPDMRNVAEAGAYLRTLRSILQYLEICDGNMEEGSFRCDANVRCGPSADQARHQGRGQNMNSPATSRRRSRTRFSPDRGVAQGEAPAGHPSLGRGPRRDGVRCGARVCARLPLLPEPDLLPLVVDKAWVDAVRAELPELPGPRRERFVRDYQLSTYDADVLTQRKDVADYFEAGIATGAPPKEMANWVMTELLRLVRDEKLDRALVIRDWPPSLTRPARAPRPPLAHEGTINRNTARRWIPRLRGTTMDPTRADRQRRPRAGE